VLLREPFMVTILDKPGGSYPKGLLTLQRWNSLVD
jgi:hypothetical protein